MAVQLPYRDAETVRLLGRLLRMRQLDSRIVNHEGQTLARPTEPLRWELTPATGEEDDYRLRLVQADGTPPPPILCTLTSHPTLYLTANAVFIGPPPHEHVLDPRRGNPDSRAGHRTRHRRGLPAVIGRGTAAPRSRARPHAALPDRHPVRLAADVCRQQHRGMRRERRGGGPGWAPAVLDAATIGCMNPRKAAEKSRG